jgi:Ni,Fe-hydrogenase I large subunit
MKTPASGVADHALHLSYHLTGLDWLAEKPAYRNTADGRKQIALPTS